MNIKTKIVPSLLLVSLTAICCYRIKDINILYTPMPFPFLIISLISIKNGWEQRWERKIPKSMAMYGPAIALIAIIALSMFAMPVKATITISNDEFYDPLGPMSSSSFEYVGSSILEPPPGWSVTGGMRFLSTDLNGDDQCDDADLDIFLGSYRSSLGYDFDNNGHCDDYDLALLSKNLGKSKHALHGDYSWSIGGPGDWYMSRYVESDCLSAIKGENIAFGFWYLTDKLYAEDGACRAEMVLDYGSQQTYEGVWIVPIPGNWTVVYVEGFCPATIVSIEVKIHLLNIKAFIDCATLSIFDHNEEEGEYGSLSVGVSIFSYKIDPGMTYDGMVRCIPTLYAEAAPGYQIKWIELKVTRVSSGDEFNLNIPYCGQQNDKGYEVDPGEEEQKQKDQLFVASIVIPFVVTAVLTFGVGAILEVAGVSATVSVVSRFAMSTTFGSTLKFLLPHFASDPDHPTADGGSLGDAVWEHWSYLSEFPWPCYPPWFDVFVNSTSAAYDLNWCFKTGSGYFFIVDIEARVCFAEPVIKSVGGGFWAWILEDRAIYEKSISISIEA